MIPIPAILSLLTTYWKPALFGLLAVAILGTITLGYRHYEHVVAQNAALSAAVAASDAALATERASNASLRSALDEWKRAEAERARRLRKLADADKEAGAEREHLNETLSKGLPDPNTAVGRLFCLFERETHKDRRGCPGDPAPEPVRPGR